MKKTVSIGLAFLLVFAIGLGLVGAVVAQAPDATATPEAGTGVGRMWGHMRAGAAAISEAVTDLLGLSQDEIHTQRLEGKTLAEIAADQKVTEEQLIDAILAEKTAAIEQAVTDGDLTREQADWMIARAKAMAPFQITNPFAGGRMGDEFGGRMGRGMSRGGMHGGMSRGGMHGGMMGERGLGVCPNVTPEEESGTSS